MKKISVFFLAALLTACVDPQSKYVDPFQAQQAELKILAGSQNIEPVSFVHERPTFEVHAPADYLPSLLARDLHKSQFETQADYEAKVHALQPSAQTVFLQVDVDQIHYVYNAEKQTLAVFVLPNESIVVGLNSDSLSLKIHNMSQFRIGNTITRHGSETMQNAFGAEVEVTDEDEKIYVLNVLNLLELPLNTRWKESDQPSYEVAGMGLAVPLPGPDAERIVGIKSVTLILGITIGDLQSAKHDVSWRDTTFTNPISGKYDYYEIPARITDIKVFDTQTGYVLASWKNQVSKEQQP